MSTDEARPRTSVEQAAVAFAFATLALVTSNMLATLLLDRVDDETWDAFRGSVAQVVEDTRALCDSMATSRPRATAADEP